MADPAPVITIDGPGGSGKGTISRLLAQRLGYWLLDSGSLYRVLALACLNHGMSPDDPAAVSRLAEALDVRFEVDASAEESIWLAGQAVGPGLRTEACSAAASQVATVPEVRRALLMRQQTFRRPPGLVADGRDMGTVVFPDAGLKVFLTASLKARAERRYKQLNQQGVSASLSGLLNELAKRDERDAARSISPLIPADDAITLDSTDLSIEAVLTKVCALAGCPAT